MALRKSEIPGLPGLTALFNIHAAPPTLEGEIKIQVPDVSDFPRIFDAITSKPDCTFVKDSIFRRKGLLFNMSIDTVGDDGKPTRLFERHGLQARKRSTINPFTRNSYDLINAPEGSIKTLLNFDIMPDFAARREYEQMLTGYADPLGGIAEKFGLHEDLRALTLAHERVQGMGVTSRLTYMFLHYMPDDRAYVAYEVCHDDNAFTTPHADCITRRDHELEAEAKFVFFLNNRSAGTGEVQDIMRRSLCDMQDFILALSNAYLAMTDSKMQRCIKSVSRFYEQQYRSFFGTPIDGHDFALLQNVKPGNHLVHNKNLTEIARQLFSNFQLAPPNEGANAKHRVALGHKIMHQLRHDLRAKNIVPA